MKLLILVLLALTVVCLVRGQCDNCCGESDVGNIRLTEPSQREYDGAVQICNQAMMENKLYISWTYIIANRLRNWTSTEATVACRQLGLPYDVPTAVNVRVQPTAQLILLTVEGLANCNGSEDQLLNCLRGQNSFRIVQEFTAVAVAGVNCNCRNGSRLVNGTSYREGRVEVCVDGRWGTVCGEGWTNEDAGHVCTRLGYPSTDASIAWFGQGSRSQHNCTITVDFNCTLVITSCQHVGVKCSSHQETVKNNSTNFVSNNQSPTTGVLAGIIAILLL